MQRGRITYPFFRWLEDLLDIRHQETFTHTRHNKVATEDELLQGYNVPYE